MYFIDPSIIQNFTFEFIFEPHFNNSFARSAIDDYWYFKICVACRSSQLIRLLLGANLSNLGTPVALLIIFYLYHFSHQTLDQFQQIFGQCLILNRRPLIHPRKVKRSQIYYQKPNLISGATKKAFFTFCRIKSGLDLAYSIHITPNFEHQETLRTFCENFTNFVYICDHQLYSKSLKICMI